jgi:hypothetical protein
MTDSTDAVSVADYPPVAVRASDLGMPAPTTIALLPRNFDSAQLPAELLDEATAATVHQLWRQAGLAEDRLDSEEEPFPSIAEHTVDWIAPIIFLGGAYAAANPAMMNIALGVVANYVYELFGRLPGRHRVRLDVVVETDGDRRTKRVTYEGDAAGIEQLLPAVERALRNGD